MKSNQKGITLVALVITVIVLLILAGITINTGINLNKDTTKDKQLSEISMVQQAILEQYTKYKIMNDEEKIIGRSNLLELTDVQSIIEKINDKCENDVELKICATDETTYEALPVIEKYYRVGISELSELGISNVSESVSYIINYATGEVINETDLVTYDNEPLYVYAVDMSESQN